MVTIALSKAKGEATIEAIEMRTPGNVGRNKLEEGSDNHIRTL